MQKLREVTDSIVSLSFTILRSFLSKKGTFPEFSDILGVWTSCAERHLGLVQPFKKSNWAEDAIQ